MTYDDTPRRKSRRTRLTSRLSDISNRQNFSLLDLRQPVRPIAGFMSGSAAGNIYEGRPFIAMESERGLDLRQFARRALPVPWQAVARADESDTCSRVSIRSRGSVLPHDAKSGTGQEAHAPDPADTRCAVGTTVLRSSRVVEPQHSRSGVPAAELTTTLRATRGRRRLCYGDGCRFRSALTGYPIILKVRKLFSLQEVHPTHRRRSIPRCVSLTRPTSLTSSGPSSSR
jgi:hypothetical protein